MSQTRNDLHIANQRGQEARRELGASGMILMNRREKLIQDAIYAHRAKKLTEKQALLMVSAITEIQNLWDELDYVGRKGNQAATKLRETA